MMYIQKALNWTSCVILFFLPILSLSTYADRTIHTLVTSNLLDDFYTSKGVTRFIEERKPLCYHALTTFSKKPLAFMQPMKHHSLAYILDFIPYIDQKKWDDQKAEVTAYAIDPTKTRLAIGYSHGAIDIYGVVIENRKKKKKLLHSKKEDGRRIRHISLSYTHIVYVAEDSYKKQDICRVALNHLDDSTQTASYKEEGLEEVTNLICTPNNEKIFFTHKGRAKAVVYYHLAFGKKGLITYHKGEDILDDFPFNIDQVWFLERKRGEKEDKLLCSSLEGDIFLIHVDQRAYTFLGKIPDGSPLTCMARHNDLIAWGTARGNVLLYNLKTKSLHSMIKNKQYIKTPKNMKETTYPFAVQSLFFKSNHKGDIECLEVVYSSHINSYRWLSY